MNSKKIKPFKGTPYKSKGIEPALWVHCLPTHKKLIAYVELRTGEKVTDVTTKAGTRSACTLVSDQQIDICFCRQLLDAEIIAHEAVHAALAILKQGKSSIRIGCDEEPLAYMVGNISRRICKWLSAIGR